jgi:hypothetical protein
MMVDKGVRSIRWIMDNPENNLRNLPHAEEKRGEALPHPSLPYLMVHAAY